MWHAELPDDVPRVLAHYARAAPFRSLLDLPDAERRALLEAGAVRHPARFADSTYLDTRRRVEAELRRRFLAAGGAPVRARPHYALIGRSARAEARAGPEDLACLLSLDRVPADRVSLTWGDSFCLDARHRALVGRSHPAIGQVFPLARLPDVLARWGPTCARPAWQELEVQLWFDPPEDSVEIVALAPSS